MMAASKKSKDRLNDCRSRYPFQLLRPHSIEPRPETIKGLHFVRWPTQTTDEWMFETRADRDKFHRQYGGEKVQ